VRLASVFEKRGRPYRIRSEAATSFSGLRERRPSVLIGAFDKEWTLRLLGETRYTFYKDFQGLELVARPRSPRKHRLETREFLAPSGISRMIMRSSRESSMSI
jgi:hypothetical protein